MRLQSCEGGAVQQQHQRTCLVACSSRPLLPLAGCCHEDILADLFLASIHLKISPTEASLRRSKDGEWGIEAGWRKQETCLARHYDREGTRAWSVVQRAAVMSLGFHRSSGIANVFKLKGHTILPQGP